MRDAYQSAQVRISTASKSLADGRPIILLSNDARESTSGTLIVAASLVDTAEMAFLIRFTSGFVVVAMDRTRLARLGLPSMVADHGGRDGVDYAIAVDSILHVTTGISAHDRAVTARQLACATAVPGDFTRPGHVMTRGVDPGGVAAHAGIPEGAVELCELAGVAPAAVYADIVQDSGERSNASELQQFATRHELASVSIDDLLMVRRRHIRHAHRILTLRMSDEAMPVDLHQYRYAIDDSKNLVLVQGSIKRGGHASLRMVVGASPELAVANGLDAILLAKPPPPPDSIPLIHCYPRTRAEITHRALSPSRCRATADILCDLGVQSVDLDNDDNRVLRVELEMAGIEVCALV